MYSLEHKPYISQHAENQRNKEENVGFVYSLQSFLFPLLFTYSAVSRCVSKQRWLSGGSLAEKNHSAPTTAGIDCSTMTVRQFLVMLHFPLHVFCGTKRNAYFRRWKCSRFHDIWTYIFCIRYYFAFSQEPRKLYWNKKHENNMWRVAPYMVRSSHR